MYDPQMDIYQPMEDAFRDWTVLGQDKEILFQHLRALSNKPIESEHVRHRDIIRGITINNILMQRHIDALEKRAKFLTVFVAVISVASLLAALAQIMVGG